MFSRWGKSKSKSSKEAKKKSNAEGVITTLHRRITRSGAHSRQRGNSTSRSKSRAKSMKHSRSPSPAKKVACFHVDSLNSVLSKPSVDSGPEISVERCPKISLERGLPLPRTGVVKNKAFAVVGEGEITSPFYSSESDDPYDSLLVSPQASDYENGIGYEANSPSVLKHRSIREMLQPTNYRASPRVPKQMLQPQHILLNAPDSLMLSPYTSPKRDSPTTQILYPLPLPPIQISIPSPFTPPFSTGTSPRIPHSPSRTDNPPSPTSHWKKGRLLGRGTFGHVYLGFNSQSGEMCAMKEVTLFSDDAKSKECAQQLRQEISLLSRLRHPNIVQYYDSEMIDDKLYIYLEYVSGGSIHTILQEYGRLGEAAIRSYTQQILSGLAYLHATNTLHRDIKGANILVDPNGRVRLADFGMAKHITGKSCPLSFKGSPYWMAPEVIKNSSSCNLAVDIWSLGCTVLEMATAKPPWSQYEGVAALFKVGNSKELPEMPDHLSDEGKDFVMKCLQRNPSYRPTAVQLLEHPFVRNISNPQTTSGALSPPGGGRKGNYMQRPNAVRGVLQKTRSSVETFFREDDYLGNNVKRPLSPNEQLYDAHFVLASRVSHQLLGSPIR